MRERAIQLPLGLSLQDEATFTNFYPGKNAEAIAELKKAANQQSEKIIYLCNAGGYGASHLMQAVCHEAHHQQMTSVYLPMNYISNFPIDILNGLDTLSIICIDDLQKIAGSIIWEEAIFHFFNRVIDNNGVLILAANNLPKSIPFILPDLISRLSWGVLFQLHPLTDEEKLSALIMRASCRGIHLSDEVAKYILTHCPRHMGTLFSALDVLDKASLAEQRRLTIPFVKSVLQI